MLAFGYLWYRYSFLILPEIKTKGNYSGKFSVVVPFFNENPKLLRKTILSIFRTEGEKEIIVVDDGSESLECYTTLNELKKQIPFKLIRYEENKGKWFD
jgi:glycosyltransferase involved in cell wall biosynthesis